jgi:AcrR family transcriptional regulator
MTTASEGKDKFYWSVLNSAVALDVRHGHLKWKVSDLARLSGVSRTLIYYYFGKSKEGILHEAVRLFGDLISGQTPDKVELWKVGNLKEANRSSRELVAKVPALVPFYFFNRLSESDIGIAIRAREKAFFDKIDTHFTHLSQAEKKGLFVLYFGLLFVPDMKQADASAAMDMMLKAALPRG